VIAAILMITGIGLLGALTANLANHWTEYFESNSENPKDRIKNELKQGAMRHLQQIDQLSPEEFETLKKMLDVLYDSGNNREQADG